jgi:2-oxoglutarate dehydrogenase E2 component (dihydrolipoamide succinyltransferase)
MSFEIKVPTLPESVADATVSTWHKKEGDFAKRDENIVDIETDKVVLEVVAPKDGILTKILKPEGSLVKADEILGSFEEKASESNFEKKESKEELTNNETVHLSPAVRKAVADTGVSPENVTGTGKNNRITGEDVRRSSTPEKAQETSQVQKINATGSRVEERVPMTRLRARVAERLMYAKNNYAILTTFNEINMHPVMEMRKKYKDHFEKVHKVKLGFMSFFVMAAVSALKKFPAVNAFIDDKDIVYHNYCDIGVAIASPRGLVVPILRNAESMKMYEIEKQIVDFSDKAKDGHLSLDEMSGGTFTISNGGVFGSLMSTPIINPPQSAILGMHKIEERPIVENGQIVIRPMMYVALSYDHRIIDGAESVRFLLAIKEAIEDPARLILDI